MNTGILKRIGVLILLCLLQALLFNKILLFGCATPLLFIYFVLSLPRNCSRCGSILWSFIMGLSVDIMSNTPGVAAASMTLIGAVKPPFLEIFIQHDSEDDLVPSPSSMGAAQYLYYSAALILLHNVVFFTLETFSFFDITGWLCNVFGSTLLTLLFVFVPANMRKK